MRQFFQAEFFCGSSASLDALPTRQHRLIVLLMASEGRAHTEFGMVFVYGESVWGLAIVW
jgi:hypothetical protein